MIDKPTCPQGHTDTVSVLERSLSAIWYCRVCRETFNVSGKRADRIYECIGCGRPIPESKGYYGIDGQFRCDNCAYRP